MANILTLTTTRDLDWLRAKVQRLTDDEFNRQLHALRAAGLIAYQSSTIQVGTP
jgi:hypothetical protein